MKPILLSTIFCIGCLLNLNAQQCSEFPIEITSQEQIDNFTTTYPGCDHTKTLRIDGGGITNLLGLEVIKSIGELTIVNAPNLTSLEGLHELNYVVNLVIQQTGITSLDGLRNLDTIYFAGAINGNDQLVDLSGLEELEVAFGLQISDNQKLESLQGLSTMVELNSLMVEYNPLLVNLTGMPALQKLDGLYLGNNDNLQDLAGLENIKTIRVGFQIIENPNLTSFHGLDALTYVGKDILIENNSSLPNMAGLQSLDTVLGKFEIINSPGLISLDGLSSLQMIGKTFLLYQNQNLADITSLTAVRTIGEQLHIEGNDNLESLSGIDFITSLGGLDLSFNDKLSGCSVESICHYLQNGGLGVIGANENGCNNASQVLQSCAVAAEDITASTIFIYPNPVSDVLRIEGVSIQDADITLSDSHGRLCGGVVLADGSMDVSHLTQGCYYLRIVTAKEIVVKGITKM